MSREDFNSYLAALEKSSDRQRSVIYVFIIVNIAILIYALNSFAYPTRQFNFDKISEIVKCTYDGEHDKTCTSDDVLGSNYFKEHQSHPHFLPDMEKAFWQYQLQTFYNDSISSRTFQVPVFGFATDRDVVWIAFPFIGILGYYIIWLALGRVHSLFRDLTEQNGSDATRLRLILSTQFLTSPLSDQSNEFSAFHKRIWKLMAISVFLIPILVSVLVILDQTNLLAVIRGPQPWDKSRASFYFVWTFGFTSKLAIQLVFIGFQIVLLRKLIGVGRAFGETQAKAHHLSCLQEA